MQSETSVSPAADWRKPPHLAAFDHQGASTNLLFGQIQHTHHLLWESFTLNLGETTLHNKRDLFEEHLKELRDNIDHFLNQDEEASPDA